MSKKIALLLTMLFLLVVAGVSALQVYNMYQYNNEGRTLAADYEQMHDLEVDGTRLSIAQSQEWVNDSYIVYPNVCQYVHSLYISADEWSNICMITVYLDKGNGFNEAEKICMSTAGMNAWGIDVNDYIYNVRVDLEYADVESYVDNLQVDVMDTLTDAVYHVKNYLKGTALMTILFIALFWLVGRTEEKRVVKAVKLIACCAIYAYVIHLFLQTDQFSLILIPIFCGLLLFEVLTFRIEHDEE